MFCLTAVQSSEPGRVHAVLCDLETAAPCVTCRFEVKLPSSLLAHSAQTAAAACDHNHTCYLHNHHCSPRHARRPLFCAPLIQLGRLPFAVTNDAFHNCKVCLSPLQSLPFAVTNDALRSYKGCLLQLQSLPFANTRLPLQTAEACKKAGAPEVDVVPCDMSSSKSIDELAKTLLDKHKCIYVLVNSAGIFPLQGQTPLEGSICSSIVHCYACPQSCMLLVPECSKGNLDIVNIYVMSSVVQMRAFVKVMLSHLRTRWHSYRLHCKQPAHVAIMKT